MAVNSLSSNALAYQIRREINEFIQRITTSGQNDPLSQRITEWFTSFKHDFFSGKQAEGLLTDYIERMQVILVDSQTGAPLDKNTVLGDDQQAYNQFSQRLCAPKDPEPHHAARHMVNWLQKHNATLFSTVQEQATEVLLSPAKEDQEMRIASILARKKELDQEQAVHLTDQATRLEKKMETGLLKLQAQTAALQKKLQQKETRLEQVENDLIVVDALDHQEKQRQLEDIEQDMDKLEQTVKRAVEEITNPTLVAIFEQTVEATYTRLKEAQSEVDKLFQINKEIGDKIKDVKVMEDNTTKEIERTKDMIKEQDERKAEKIAITIVAVVASYVIIQALPPLAVGGSSSTLSLTISEGPTIGTNYGIKAMFPW